MGGGTAHRNEKNIQESDESMKGKIQRIETIKHMPNHWHLDFWSSANWWSILGGFGTAAYTLAGVGIAVIYF